MTDTTRLTVLLRPGDRSALDELMQTWGVNQTDATHRALRLAALLVRLAGDRPVRVDTPDGVEMVRFL